MSDIKIDQSEIICHQKEMTEQLDRRNWDETSWNGFLVNDNMLKMNILCYIFIVSFIYSVRARGWYNNPSPPSPCYHYFTHGTLRHLFSDASNCAKYYSCSHYKDYEYVRIRSEHKDCPQGKSFVTTSPNGQPIEAGGACIGDHPSKVRNCYTLRGEIFWIHKLAFHFISFNI